MKKAFHYWMLVRYIFCTIVAVWGFILIFQNGINSGGKILLLISGIGAVSTFVFDYLNARKLR